MVKDLGSFLKEYEAAYPEDVVHIDKEINSNQEVTAIVIHLEKQGKYPLLVFHNVLNAEGKKAEQLMVINVLASRTRYARICNSTYEMLGRDVYEATRVRRMAPDADLRIDLPKYRVYQDGELIDEPTDITTYWRDDLVCFLIGCSRTFVWALRAVNISFRRYGAYRTNLPCVPAGRFHGHLVVTVRAFYNAHDAVRAVQISSRHLLMHGPPIHIGDPADIGVENIGQPDSFNPNRPVAEPPKSGEIVMSWGCGVTPQAIAIESKIPFMITHCPVHMFVTDRLAEELAIL